MAITRSTSLRAGSEQLTYLLFLKMADPATSKRRLTAGCRFLIPRCGLLEVLHERTKPPYNQPSAVPEKYNSLQRSDLDEFVKQS